MGCIGGILSDQALADLDGVVEGCFGFQQFPRLPRTAPPGRGSAPISGDRWNWLENGPPAAGRSRPPDPFRPRPLPDRRCPSVATPGGSEPRPSQRSPRYWALLGSSGCPSGALEERDLPLVCPSRLGETAQLRFDLRQPRVGLGVLVAKGRVGYLLAGIRDRRPPPSPTTRGGSDRPGGSWPALARSPR